MSKAHVHKMIAQTAREMAHELYDTLMQNNSWYEIWKARFPEKGTRDLEATFVAMNWGKLIPQAREQLGLMLGMRTVDEKTKEIIMEALVLDNALLRGRQNLRFN